MNDQSFSLAKLGHPDKRKRAGRAPTLRLLEEDEIIVDCFAGGGGASLGLELALGRKVTVAINHDPEAIAMHKANHPETEHYIEDVYDANPVAVCRGRKVGLAWFSPDCTEHSRAKNGAIVRDKKIRGLAWVVVDWAKAVRPRVIMLENVEEWWNWGPLAADTGQIDKARKGEYRALWWRRLEDMGYQVSKRVMKACDYGAPTSRKRLFIMARCDGIDPESCWPEATHGPGRELPYRTAAECIDYSLPCPSIFMTKAEAKQFAKETGIRCKRPLVDKTMQRIRRGIYKYVLNCAKPFTIRLTGDDPRVYNLDEPMRTVTGANRGEFGLVTPIITPVKTWGGGGNEAASADRPLRTITTSKRGEFAVVAPYLARTAHGEVSAKGKRRGQGSHSVEHPLPTVCASSIDYALVAPTLIQTGYGERAGQAPRCLDLKAPLGTIISGGGGNGNGKHALVAAYLYKGFGDDSAKRTGGFPGGQAIDKPIGAITVRDHHQLAVSHLLKLRGTSDSHMDASSMSAETPIPTISANGNHVGEVRAFLTKFHGSKQEDGDGRGSSLDMPIPTIDTSRRFGLVMIEGEEYQIVDIGMRMLEPRELYRAQGFPDSYIIDPITTRTLTWTTKNGKKHSRQVTGPLTETAQVEKCGNSVSPPMAAAMARSAFPATASRSLRAA